MKKYLKSVQLICILLLVCTLFLTACGGTQQPPVSSEPEGSENASTNDNDNNINDSNNDNQISDEKKEKYDQACALISQGKIEEAYTLLKSISTYAPAQEKLKNFFYAPAKVTDTCIYSTSNSPITSITEYKYNKNGNITEIKQGSKTATFVYDAKGNILIGCDVLDIWGGNITYTYDQNGVLIKETDVDGDVTSYEYNEKGFLVKKHWVGLNRNTMSVSDMTDTYEYEFYSNGNVKTMTHKEDPNYMFDSQITKYTYNENGTLIRVEENLTNYPDEDALITTITYGEYGIASVKREYDTSKAIIQYTYDNAGALIRMDCSEYDDNELFCTYIYTFENNQLFYSENKNTHERASLVNQMHIETILSYMS